MTAVRMQHNEKVKAANRIFGVKTPRKDLRLSQILRSKAPRGDINIWRVGDVLNRCQSGEGKFELR